ncbi:MAG: DUF1653 domain-containing protein [Butyrivibrio sp.]|nr:DUF1653 domain-containing protein [Butyrivibrio sp.]
MSDSRTVIPGDKFRHFKNKLYQIVAVAYHSETQEKMVVYQALYGDYRVYVRPYDMFMGEVDRVKYPNAAQRYRFEKTESVGMNEEKTREQSDSAEAVKLSEPSGEEAGLQEGVNPYLLEFFDREGCKEKMEYLNSIRNKVDDKLISDIAVSMDFTVGDGTVDERLNSLLYCLRMKARFECGRLR